MPSNKLKALKGRAEVSEFDDHEVAEDYCSICGQERVYLNFKGFCKCDEEDLDEWEKWELELAQK